MATSYTGVLSGDRIVWTGGAKPPDGPVQVTAIQQLTESDEERRLAILAALESIAARGNINAEEWEQDRRASRTRTDPRD